MLDYLYSVIVVTLSIWMGKNFEIPFKKIANNIESLKESNDTNKIDSNFSTEEFIFLQKFIVDAFAFKEEKDKAKKELGEITAQVAYDVRSPLSALDTVVKSISSKVSEQERIMIRNSFRRINNIANDLVARYKGRESQSNILLFIYVVLKDIVSEKDLEHANKNISFELTLDDPQSAFLITEGNYKEIRRVLSNLVNNAVNAMPNGGRIQLICEKMAGTVFIKICDQGCGLSAERVSQLLSEDRAQTAGIGLGLKHAKEYMKNHSGEFKMRSQEGVGTEVILSFQILPKPKWLAEKLEIDFAKPVMILGDDASIHDIWTKKFEGFKVQREDFYTTHDAREALEKGSKPGLVLCDYEFVGQDEVGLTFLESIRGIDAEKYLVTTHVDNEEILNRCEDLGLQLIPKHLLPYVGVQAQDKATARNVAHKEDVQIADAVMIDDEAYNHEFWKFAAKLKNKTILCFLSLEEFDKAAADIPFDMPIYVDLNLKNVSGLVVTKTLHERGFNKLYIATGLVDFDPKEYPYLAGVQGKEPPF